MSLESSIISFVAQKLGDLLVDEVKLLKGVQDQVQSMQRELKWIGSYLRDVDEGQEESNHTLRTRIEEIRKITFKAEDVIDSFIFLQDTRTRKSFLKRYVFSFPNYLVQRHQIASEIKAINTIIQENKKTFETYHVSGRNEQIRRRLPKGNPLNKDDFVCGLKEDVNRLVKKLTAEKHQEKVLCIAGMGGSGKTTLAKELYNHETIKQHFQYRGWVSISKKWSVDHILVQILRQITVKEKKSDETRSSEELVAEATGRKKKSDETRSFEDWSFEELVAKVHNHLEQGPYLIVLDDVWEKEALKSLLPAFPFRNKVSKIIITTRNSNVVKVPGVSYSSHEPRRLNGVESWDWDLLTKIVLNQWRIVNNNQLIGNFETLGKEMLKRCDGLPLAIIALGGILCCKYTIEEWNKISENVSAKVMEGSGTQDYDTVKDVLALSYHDLPYELKPCFLYFALFPEDFIIPVGQLKRMWISEGFITKEQCCPGETLKDVARRFLDELIQRCVVQVAVVNYKEKVIRVQIHDLIREFCIEKAKERDFLEIFPLQSSTAQEQIEGGTIIQSRRIGIYSSLSDICILSRAQNSNVRSLFVFLTNRQGRNINLAGVHKNFLFLKVLDITTPDGFVLDLVLPTEIGNLIHLTYFRIKCPTNVILPESIVNLRSLLTLDCRDCELLFKKGHKFWWKMYRVRHLLFAHLEVSHGILKFAAYKSLQTLLGVVGGDWMLDKMSTLSPTVNKLQILDISTDKQLEAVFQCPSFKSGHLQTLSLHWKLSVQLRNIGLSFICHGLRKLKLNGPIEDEDSFPPNLFPPNLEKVILINSKLTSNETMAAVGKLSNLRYLYLAGWSYMGAYWTCSAREFPQLERLEMYNLPILKEWKLNKGAMPCLKFLRVSRCPRLIRLPKLGNNVEVHVDRTF